MSHVRSALSVREWGLTKALFWLGWFTGVAFVVIGIAGGIWPGHWDDASAGDQILWVVFDVGGLAILGGFASLDDRPGREPHWCRLARLPAPCPSSGRSSRWCSPLC